jgi:hypothetical protein
MKKIKKDEVLYGEISHQQWVDDVIEKYNMLPDLKTKYADYIVGESWEILQYANRYVQFDIETENGKMTLNGVFVQFIPNEDMRNIFDQLFLPMSNVKAFIKLEKEKAPVTEQLKLGHFINVGTATNIIQKQP